MNWGGSPAQSNPWNRSRSRQEQTFRGRREPFPVVVGQAVPDSQETGESGIVRNRAFVCQNGRYRPRRAGFCATRMSN